MLGPMLTAAVLVATVSTLKRENDLLAAHALIVEGEHRVVGAQERAQAASLKASRLQELYSAQSTTETAYREARLLADVAMLDAGVERAKLDFAKADELRLQGEPACEGGDCTALEGAYAAVRAARTESARLATNRCLARLDLERWNVTAMRALIATGVVDARIVN